MQSLVISRSRRFDPNWTCTTCATTVDSWLERLPDITQDYEACNIYNIYNMDEALPDKSLAVKYAGGKKSNQIKSNQRKGLLYSIYVSMLRENWKNHWTLGKWSSLAASRILTE